MSNDGVQYNVQILTGSSTVTLQQISQGFEGVTERANGLNSAIRNIGAGAFIFNNIAQSVGAFTNAVNQAIQPGIALDSSLHDLKAITGATDDQLKMIKESARESAKAFGIDAAQGVESYKILLSKLGPELAQTPQQLKAMGDNVSILSKQLGGNTAGAAEILSTAMNQYGVSIKDPIQATKTMASMMNIMSAAAQEGSAELPEIKSALEQSGMMAKTANVSFVELNSAIQVLDKAGKKGTEGGVAIRNALSIMSEGRFMHKQAREALEAHGISVAALGDKNKTFQERLEMLKPVIGDTALMSRLFGRENVAAGIALVQGTDQMGEYTEKIKGTSSAVTMAKDEMGSYQEQMNRTWATVKNFGISFFDAFRPILPAIQIVGSATTFAAMFGGALNTVGIIANSSFGKSIASATTSMWGFVRSTAATTLGLLRNAVQFALTGAMMIGSFVVGLVSATAAQLGLNVAMSANPIGLIIIGIASAVGAIVVLIKYWDQIKSAIASFASWVFHHSPFGFLIDVVEKVFPQFKTALDGLWKWVKDKFDALVGWLKDAFGWIKKLFTGGDSKQAGKDQAKAYADAMQSSIPGIDYAPTANQKNNAITGKGSMDMSDLSDTSSKIGSGGARPTNINITIGKFQDKIELHTVNMREGMDELQSMIEQRLLAVLNSANSMATR